MTYASQSPIPNYDDTWSKVHKINNGVDISKEVDTEFIAEMQGTKWVPTTVDLDKIKFVHNNILKSQCKTGAEYEYHLKKIEDFMHNHIVWESRQPDDIIESVISCETAKATWTDLVHSFVGPFDTKENRIMDLKLEYQISELNPLRLSHRHAPVTKPCSMRLPMMGLRNANHTQTLDLGDIYRWFVYEDNLISRRYSDTKKALITAPSNSPISNAFFSNNTVHDFQENFNDEADERSCEEYLRDLELEFHEREPFCKI
ncbi:hypothetical protein Tco_1164219 [Tanacetum coccineum]